MCTPARPSVPTTSTSPPSSIPSSPQESSPVKPPYTSQSASVKEETERRASQWQKFKVRRQLRRLAKKDEDNLIDALDFAFDPTLDQHYATIAVSGSMASSGFTEESDFSSLSSRKESAGESEEGGELDGPVDEEGETVFEKRRREMKKGLEELERSGGWVVL